MANKLIKDNHYAPFMGENKSISVGLNPLGMRTASEQLFTTLLPGMNVVTLRIRYYSFYCWLLQQFRDRIKKETNKTEQKLFIRKAELLMALIHANNGTGDGIPGITKAQEIIYKRGETINFNNDANPDGKPTGGYWKSTFGAFGMYYIASLQEMGLVGPLSIDKKMYSVTEHSDKHLSGEDLANIFAKTIGKSNAELFIECAEKGIVSKKQLEELEPSFQAHYLNEDWDERESLCQMILQKDQPLSEISKSLRRETIKLFLKYIKTDKSSISDLGFAKFIYQQVKEGKTTDTSAIGWYAYYLNDNRQYECLNIFNSLLIRLLESQAPGQWEKIDDFSQKLADEVCIELNQSNISLKQLFNNWDSIEEPDSESMAHSFYVLLDDFVKNQDYEKNKDIIKNTFFGIRNDAMDFYDTIPKCKLHSQRICEKVLNREHYIQPLLRIYEEI